MMNSWPYSPFSSRPAFSGWSRTPCFEAMTGGGALADLQRLSTRLEVPEAEAQLLERLYCHLRRI
jgi:hypothetical protein